MRDVVNILVVEDDDVDVESLRRLFAKNGIKNPVYHAANGYEALDIMRGDDLQGGVSAQRLAKPFIVLLDINMPLMNGLELLKALRADENLKDTVVFILTTSPRSEDKDMTYQMNVAGYFLKKDIHQLITLLRLYWEINEFPDQKIAI